MQRKIVPDIVEPQDVATLKADDTVAAAAKMMADKHVAAVIVVDADDNITGIITERDITQRVVAVDLDAKATAVGEVMTENPDTLAPDDHAGDALELMQTRRYRHLPVTENGACIAVVSIRDLHAAVKATLEESIRETEAFVFGDRYGG